MLPDPYNNLPENSAQNGLASVNVHVREKAGTLQRRPGGDSSPLVLPQVTQRSRSCFLPLAESIPNTGPRPLRAFSACPSPTSLIQQQLLSSIASCSSADFCRRSYQVPYSLLPSPFSLLLPPSLSRAWSLKSLYLPVSALLKTPCYVDSLL